MPIQDVPSKTNRERWTIERSSGRRSGRSVQAAWHDDDDIVPRNYSYLIIIIIIPAKRPDLLIVNKKGTCRIVDFAVQADHRVKIKENEKKRQILRSCQRTKKVTEHEGNGDTNCNLSTWNDHQRLNKRAGGVGNRRPSRVHLNYSIVQVG